MNTELLQQQYDSMYASDGYFSNQQPVAVVTVIPSFLPEAKVLDLGAGEGRNALFLIERGYAVTAWDLSKVGLQKLQAAAASYPHHSQLMTKVCDITTEPLLQQYDVVVCTFVLHHLSYNTALSVLSKAKAGTSKGGFHAIVTFGNEGGLYERASRSGRFYPDDSQLKELYRDWRVMQCEKRDMLTLAKDTNGNRMKNSVLSLLIKNE